MAEEEEPKKKEESAEEGKAEKKGSPVAGIAVVVLLLAAAGGGVFLFVSGSGDDPKEKPRISQEYAEVDLGSVSYNLPMGSSAMVIDRTFSCNPVLILNHKIENMDYTIRDSTESDNVYTPHIFSKYRDECDSTDVDCRSRYAEEYIAKPLEISGYFQDKMEFDDMVINLGIRYDYFDPNISYPGNVLGVRRSPFTRFHFSIKSAQKSFFQHLKEPVPNSLLLHPLQQTRRIDSLPRGIKKHENRP